MTDDELQIVADKICQRLSSERKEFWIEPESHYNAHHDISDLIADYRQAKSVFWKAFIGLAVVGALVLGMLGLGYSHK